MKTILCRLFLALAIVLSAIPAPATVRAVANYYVDAVHGSDLASGSQAAPWKTITHALSLATAGDTVNVLPGTYNKALGETFPLAPGPGVRLVGQDRDTVILAGDTNGAELVSYSSSTVDFGSDSLLDNFTLQAGFRGVIIRPKNGHTASPTLKHLLVRSMSSAGILYTAGFLDENGGTISAQLSDIELRENALGLGVDADCTSSSSSVTLVLDRVQILDSSNNGISSYAKAPDGYKGEVNLTIRSSRIEGNGQRGIAFTSESGGVMNIDISSTIIRDNHNWGILFSAFTGGSSDINAALNNVLVAGNSSGGIIITPKLAPGTGPSTVTIRNSAVVNNQNVGIQWNGAGEPNFVVPLVVNTILWNPKADDLLSYDTRRSWTAAEVQHSIIEDGDLEGQAGNFSADPLFQPDGYHLSACSPAINAGLATGAPVDDIDGESRPKGSAPDIGADEYDAACLVDVNLSASAATITSGMPLVYTLNLSNCLSNQSVSFSMTDPIAPPLFFVSDSLTASLGNAVYENGSITWTGILSPGGSAQLVFTTRPVVTSKVLIVNQAVVDTETGLHISQAVSTMASPAMTFIPSIFNTYCLGPDIDDFSDPSSGWPVGKNDYVNYGYLNGEYQIYPKRRYYEFYFRAPTCQSSNYIVEADARWAENPTYGYSLLFGINPEFDSFYFLRIDVLNQAFGVWHYSGDSYNPEIRLGNIPSTAINRTTGNNHLKVEVKNRFVTVWINGKNFGTFDEAGDFSVPTGVGLGAEGPYPAQIATRSDARFDNFVLTPLYNVSKPGVNASVLNSSSSPAETVDFLMLGIDLSGPNSNRQFEPK